MAIKDVEGTKAKLESERDALSEEITDFDVYTKNVDKVKAYYEDALKQTELLSIRLREYAYKYAELIMNEDVSYKVKYKDLSGIYEYIYEDAGKDMYDKQNALWIRQAANPGGCNVTFFQNPNNIEVAVDCTWGYNFD